MENSFSSGNKLLNVEGILKKAGIKDGMIVADLGCGANGYFCFPASRLVGDKGFVYAVDVRKTALDSIKSRSDFENINNIKTIWTNLEIYGMAKIKSGFLDLALLINILFQSNKKFNILKEAVRLIKNKGKIIVIDWKENNSAIGPALELRINKADIQAMFHSLNIEQIDEFDAGKYHFGMIFEK
ncbi:MAG: methyltransferase domain-containing protein [Xanthomonadaceae bacterium]|nr:methyltransferase domain-containing protein [Rhodospirillaceae bacterium]NIA17711.1 methyltransferase domain-containing protein [Xanthomonadaceae bacterium]